MQIRMSGTKNNSCQGFTLLELSIVLLISGLILSLGIFLALNYLKAIQIEKADRVVENANKNLSDFLGTYARYPCPADPAILPGNPNYGVESCGPVIYVQLYSCYMLSKFLNQVKDPTISWRLPPPSLRVLKMLLPRVFQNPLMLL